jgi:hypothetical protein
MHKGVHRRWRMAALLATGIAIGVVIAGTPAGAHVTDWTHNWTQHIRPKADARYYTKTQANARFSRAFASDRAPGLTTITGVHGAGRTEVDSVAVVAGSYFVSANVLIFNTSATVDAEPRCYLMAPGQELEGIYHRLSPDAGTNVYRLFFPIQAIATLSSPGSFRVECSKNEAGESVGAIAQIFAIRVNAVTQRGTSPVPSALLEP